MTVALHPTSLGGAKEQKRGKKPNPQLHVVFEKRKKILGYKQAAGENGWLRGGLFNFFNLTNLKSRIYT